MSETQKERIYKHIRESDRPLTPKEIALHLNINRKTVRARIAELRREGKVARAFHGHYTCDKIHGGRETPEVAFGGERIQNLHVLSKKLDVKIPFRDRVVKEWKGVGPDNVGSLKVMVELAAGTNRVNWTLSAPEGVDLQGLRLCRAYVESVLECRGYSGFGWEVRNIERFRDFMGIRLEGLKALTLDNLDSTLEKIYQKSYGLRHEVRTSKILGLDETQALLQGGVPTMNIVQGVNMMARGQNNLIDEIRGLMDHIYDLNKNVKANTDAIYRIADKN